MKFHDFTRRVVIDTNIIVSALISTNGAAARFLGDVFDEKYEVILTETMFLEY